MRGHRRGFNLNCLRKAPLRRTAFPLLGWEAPICWVQLTHSCSSKLSGNWEHLLAVPLSFSGTLPLEGSSAGLLGDGALSNHEWHPASSSVSQNLVADHADSFVGDPPLIRQCRAASLSMNQITRRSRNFSGQISFTARQGSNSDCPTICCFSPPWVSFRSRWVPHMSPKLHSDPSSGSNTTAPYPA